MQGDEDRAVKEVVAVIVPRGSSGYPEAQMPPIVDRFTHELVAAMLVRVFGRRLPGNN